MGKSSHSSGNKNVSGTNIISPASSQMYITEKDISTSDVFKKLERQNEILLFICEETVRIRSKEDMQHIIQNTIKQYIPFDDSLILRYNKNTRTARIYIYHAEKQELENPTGSSCFATAGAPNPTLSLTALSLRLSDHLKETVKEV